MFDFAAGVQARPVGALLGLGLWAFINGALVFGGYADMRVISLALGFIGAGAVVGVSALLAMSHLFEFLRYCGKNSIVIYLAFFLFMAASRTVLLKTGIIPDLGTVSLIVTTAGVIGALCWYWAVRNTPFKFLFARPAPFRLKSKKPAVAMQPAE